MEVTKNLITKKVEQIKADLVALAEQARTAQQEIQQRQETIRRIELTSIKLSGAIEAYESVTKEMDGETESKFEPLVGPSTTETPKKVSKGKVAP